MIFIIIVSVVLNLILGFVIFILFLQQRNFLSQYNLKIDLLTKENSNLIKKILSILRE
jgi:hypothetical protein